MLPKNHDGLERWCYLIVYRIYHVIYAKTRSYDKELHLK
nr:MAG TPA: hypothetical protein [Caudoviricetes sp.]